MTDSESLRPAAGGSLMEVAVERLADSTVVRCSGELDMATSRRLDEAIEQVDGARNVVIDCEKLTFIDSTGVRSILRAVEHFDKSSIGWKIVPGVALRRVSGALGLDAAIGLEAE